MKNFDEWNEVKKKTDFSNKTFVLDEGEIWWCRVGLNVGDETVGKGKTLSRPILIVKKFTSNVFWGIPITMKNKKGSWYYKLENIDRTVVLNQMRLFDRKRLEERIFVISEKHLNEIKDKICFLLKSQSSPKGEL